MIPTVLQAVYFALGYKGVATYSDGNQLASFDPSVNGSVAYAYQLCCFGRCVGFVYGDNIIYDDTSCIIRL